MSFRQSVHHIKQVLVASRQGIPNEGFYDPLVNDALIACSRWFGPPSDPERQIFYARSAEYLSSCGYFFGSYIIYLCPTLDTPEECCADIGHEMYNRVTMRRDGLRRETWIDEMMAFLASQWFLRRHWYGHYAGRVAEHYGAASARVDVTALCAFRRRLPLVNLKGLASIYPDDFYPDVSRLVSSLNLVVRRRDLVRLPWSQSLEDWLRSLPLVHRAAARCLLECPATPDDAPDRLPDSVRMARALRLVDRMEDVRQLSRRAERWSWQDAAPEISTQEAAPDK